MKLGALNISQDWVDKARLKFTCRPLTRIDREHVDLEALMGTPLNFFCDYRPAGMRFAHFDDECIDVEYAGVWYEMFGQSNDGLYVRDRSCGHVWTIAPQEDCKRFANTTIDAFLRCHCLFVSHMTAGTAGLFASETWDTDIVHDLYGHVAMSLAEDIERIHPAALDDGTYWRWLVDALQEGAFSFHPGLAPFIESGRWPV
jgi:hypothetical protein